MTTYKTVSIITLSDYYNVARLRLMSIREIGAADVCRVVKEVTVGQPPELQERLEEQLRKAFGIDDDDRCDIHGHQRCFCDEACSVGVSGGGE